MRQLSRAKRAALRANIADAKRSRHFAELMTMGRAAPERPRLAGRLTVRFNLVAAAA